MCVCVYCYLITYALNAFNFCVSQKLVLTRESRPIKSRRRNGEVTRPSTPLVRVSLSVWRISQDDTASSMSEICHKGHPSELRVPAFKLLLWNIVFEWIRSSLLLQV